MYPAPGTAGIDASDRLLIRFNGPTYFEYVRDAKLRVIDAETGDRMGPEVEFRKGDPQEGKREIELPMTQFGLLAGSEYYVEADRGWARLNAEPWIVEAIPARIWAFRTAGERPVLTRPDAMSFEERRDVQPGVVVQSGRAAVLGINVAVPVTVENGEYSVDGGAFTSAPGVVARKGTLRLRGRSAESPDGETNVTARVGDGVAAFRIRTAPSDGLPRGFTFLGRVNATPGEVYESEEVTIAGLDAPVALSITGGEYSLDGGDYIDTGGTIGNGQRLRLRVKAPVEYNRDGSAVVRVGGASADFTVRTMLMDPRACRVKNIGVDPTSPNGRRLTFNFPTVDAVEPGEIAVSACVKVVGVGSTPVTLSGERAGISINDGPYSVNPGALREGDTIRLRLTASRTAGEKVEDSISIGRLTEAGFAVRTRNNDREPVVFQVGPGRDIHQIADIAAELREGDIVEVDGDATYSDVKLQRPGSAAHPIVIRGMPVNGRRPVISGGTHTLHFQEANHYRVENFEVTGGEQTCVRVMADGIVLRDVWIHGCPRHGLLGADYYTGNVTLDRVEISDAGGQIAGENLKHGLYVATDRDRYPGSRLRLQFSHIHDIRGDAVKTRSERNEIYYNWIDTGTDRQAIYTLELLGYQEYDTDVPIDSDVAGNVLVHRLAYGVRFGGDGTGVSRGRVRLANNTIVAGARFDQYTPVVRLFQGIDGILFQNSMVVKLEEGGQPGLRLMRADEVVWTSGKIKVAGRNNWLPTGTVIEVDGGKDWLDTQDGAANPGLNSITSADDLDVSLRPNVPLRAAGAPLTLSVDGYQIGNSLTEIRYWPPAIQPAAGQPLTPRFSTGGTAIGAH